MEQITKTELKNGITIKHSIETEPISKVIKHLSRLEKVLIKKGIILENELYD